MNEKKVTESPEELLSKANSDVIAIISLIKNEELFTVDDRETVGVHAQQMAEKLLKGYLRNNEITKDNVSFGHDLKVYIKEAESLDQTFANIKPNVLNVNNYTAEARYSGKNTVSDNDFEEMLYDIKTIYTFKAFRDLYDTLDAKKTRGIIDIKYFDEIIEIFKASTDNALNRITGILSNSKISLEEAKMERLSRQ